MFNYLTNNFEIGKVYTLNGGTFTITSLTDSSFQDTIVDSTLRVSAQIVIENLEGIPVTKSISFPIRESDLHILLGKIDEGINIYKLIQLIPKES